MSVRDCFNCSSMWGGQHWMLAALFNGLDSEYVRVKNASWLLMEQECVYLSLPFMVGLMWLVEFPCNFNFFQNLFLMMVLKCFSLPCNSPPTRGSGKERIWRGGEVDLYRKVIWCNSRLCCLEISSSVHRLAGSGSLIHSQTLHGYTSSPVWESWVSNSIDTAGLSAEAWVSRGKQQDCQEKFSGVPHSGKEAEISEDRRATSVAQLAVPTSQALSLSLHGVLFIPSKHHVSSMCMHGFYLSTCLQSARVLGSRNKLQHTTGSFWCVSLYGVSTNAAQLHSIRQTNTCVSLAKNPSSRVLSHVCFSRTSSLPCLLQHKRSFKSLP
jgi:hypothetical protein